MENCKLKKRCGVYISNNIKYHRKSDLEGPDSHLVIIDIDDGIKLRRIINIYRSFNPINESAKDLFGRQLDQISAAFNYDSILLGDLNLE